MTIEFTGERVVPGQVDDDLWNEHFARYTYAARYARGKRVLDCGCGTGYGSAELATVASSVTGIDVASEAVQFARQYPASFAQSSCTRLPFRAGSFDLVVCFEVIEHLQDWSMLLDEVRRVLAPGGRFLVSTPNKEFYADARRESGPNPYHEHEFEYAEFRDALAERFGSVSLLAEDHVESIVFRSEATEAQARLQPSGEPVSEAAYFVAVCGGPAEPFVFVPKAANALREKSVHIERLAGEIRTKDGWLAQQQSEHQELLRQHEALQKELASRQAWAEDLAGKLDAAGRRIVDVQNEYAAFEQSMKEAIEGYQAEIVRLNELLHTRVAETEELLRTVAADRDRQTAELARCVEALHATEAVVEERTRWAKSLDARLAEASGSKWLRLGRALKLGPELEPR